MSFWTTVVVEFSVAIRTEGAKKMAQVNHSTMKPGNHRIHHPLFKQNANSSVVQTLGDNAINNVFLAMLVLAWLTPTLMLFVSSFRPVADMMTTGWWTAFLRPGRFTVENYQVVLASKGIVNNFMNSLIITIPATVLPICIGALAAYPISFYKFPGRKLIFVGLIAMQIIPLQTVLVPVLMTLKGLRVYGTFCGIWLAHSDCRYAFISSAISSRRCLIH